MTRNTTLQQEMRPRLIAYPIEILSAEGTEMLKRNDIFDDDCDISYDDLSEDEGEGPLFSMGMTR